MKKLYLIALIFLLFPAPDIQAAVLYSQPPGAGGTLYQSSRWAPDGSDYDEYVWDNFTLSANQSISLIEWAGGYDPVKSGSGGPALDFSVRIFPSIAAGTEPDVINPPLVSYQTGNNAGETLTGAVNGINMYSYSFSLPVAFDAAAGIKYWIQIEASQNGIPDWGIASGTGDDGGYFRKIRNPSTGDPNFYQLVSGDAAFTLSGSACTPAIEAASEGATCSDGIDNDCDNAIDTNDTDCSADLVVISVSDPPVKKRRGGSFGVQDVVMNRGATSVQSITRYYLSKDTVKSKRDILLRGKRIVLPLDINTISEELLPTKVTIPAGTPVRKYYLIACADVGNKVTETDETNNCTASFGMIKVRY